MTTLGTLVKVPYTRGGSTNPGQGWVPMEGGYGIYIDVDTRAGEFNRTPVYVASIAGKSKHWALLGASAIYRASPISFRVHVMWRDRAPLTPAQATDNEWHINWSGYELRETAIDT